MASLRYEGDRVMERTNDNIKGFYVGPRLGHGGHPGQSTESQRAWLCTPCERVQVYRSIQGGS